MDSDEENEDYVIEAERKAKQTYLNEEVLEIGYSPQLFMEFISRIKAPDIDLWTFDELQAVVKDFKSKNRPSDSPAAPLPISQKKEEIHQNLPEIPMPIPSAPEEIPVLEEEKLDTNVIKSKSTEKNVLTGCGELKINVSEPQVTGGGFLSKKFVVYMVTCSPMGWSVKRRYSDFLWLREALCINFLGSYLPPIPPKKATGSLEEKRIFKRQQSLNQFMVVLSKDKLILTSPLFLVFLQETDEKKFKKFVKSTKLKKIETAENTMNFDGQAFVEFSDCSKTYDKQMSYVLQCEALKKKIKQKCSQIMEEDKHLSESLKKFADIVKELQDTQSKIPNNENNSMICALLYESLMSWSGFETENIADINRDIRIPFSFSYKEMSVIKELLKERESAYATYRKLEAKQKPDKSRDALEKSKEMYGYLNYKTQREVERVLIDETQLAFAHFNLAAKHQAERATMLHMIWGGLMSKLSDMKFDSDSLNNEARN